MSCVCFQEGMRQHFELGRFLRNRYKGFLNESYDRHEVDALCPLFFPLSHHMTPHRTLTDRRWFINVRREAPPPPAMSVLYRVPTGAAVPGTWWKFDGCLGLALFKLSSIFGLNISNAIMTMLPFVNPLPGFVHRSQFAAQTTIAPWWALKPTSQVWTSANSSSSYLYSFSLLTSFNRAPVII